MQVSRRTTYRSYLFGDFDRDGVKNVDDYRPFDPKIKAWPDPNKNPSFYHKARFGGFDTKFSDVLLDIERLNNRSSPMLKRFVKGNPGSKGRIKTIPSTIEKMKKKSYHNVSDIAGAMVVVENRKQVRAKAQQIKKKYRHNPRETDDFYRKPKNDVYYAYHLGLIDKKNKSTMEVQIKSKPMNKLHTKMHEAYKHGKHLADFKKEAKELFKLGF